MYECRRLEAARGRPWRSKRSLCSPRIILKSSRCHLGKMRSVGSGVRHCSLTEIELEVNPNRVDGVFVGHGAQFGGTGRAPLVAPGKHKVTISLPGYQTFETDIDDGESEIDGEDRFGEGWSGGGNSSAAVGNGQPSGGLIRKPLR
jgi:hypothetical protein